MKTITFNQLKRLVKEAIGSDHHKWDDFDKFDDKYISKYLPAMGEGDTMASQIATAVCKLVYKWFNDGDLYDNTENGMCYFNDLSSYANWLSKYVPESREVLFKIFRINTTNFDGEYTDLLYDLCSTVLPNIGKYASRKNIGSVYSCDGPYKTVDEDNEDDGDGLF